MVVLLFMRRLVPTDRRRRHRAAVDRRHARGMWFWAITLDNFSLMALTISVGFVVDDAIVMIENIVRHMEQGMTPLQAALERRRGRSASP